MTADIILIIFGLIIVFLSYFLSEKVLDKLSDKNKKEKNAEIEANDNLQFIEEIEQIKDKVETILEDKKINKMIEVEEDLGHISNEKIMAFDEFSKQVFEKIEANHKEVVFLFNMLNEKKEEIKKIINETDQFKVTIKEFLFQMKQEEEQITEKVLELESISKQCMKINDNISVEPEKPKELKKENVKLVKPNESFEDYLNNQDFTSDVQEVEEMMELMSEEEKEMLLGDMVAVEPEETSDKQKILHLYEKGKSVREISKQLGRGQGEVQLIIDLFQSEVV